jgi:hypothetical protein
VGVTGWLALALVLSGCATVDRKPVEVESPAAERHFIVMSGGVGTPP